MPDVTAPIVVGVDGSLVALRAARWAGALAERLGAPLHILTATPHLGRNLSGAATAMCAAAIAAQRDSVEQILRNTQDAVHRIHPALVVTTAAFDEAADEVLVRASLTARLVVLGCDDLTAAGAVLVGSTMLATLTDAHCPVVAWRGDTVALTRQPIVVGVQGAGDDSALAIAFELASCLEAPLKAIHSWSLPRPAIDLSIPVVIDWQAWEDSQWLCLNERITPWCERYPGIDVTLICGPVKSSHALLRHADGAQLLVVGSRRRNALTRMVFGSTSLNLLHHSKVPVVLCPTTRSG